MRYEYAVNVFVFNHDYTALLFVKRKKPPFKDQYLPPGGHVESDESPTACARREVKEETGLTVHIVDFRPGLPIVLDSDTVRLPSPIHVQVENIDAEHRHVDFIFVGELNGETDDIPEKFKKDGVQWMTLNEIKSARMPRNVKDLSMYLFRYRQGE